MTTGKLTIVLEQTKEGRWSAIYMGHCSPNFATKEQACEALRQTIANACFAANVVAVETYELDLAESYELNLVESPRIRAATENGKVA